MAGIRAAFKVFFLNFVLQRLTETCVLFPTTAYALHVGSNRARTNLCFKKYGRQFSNSNFPLGQVNGFEDNLDFEKNITWDRLKINTADPSHF
jgi:hypothetical protein